LAAGEEPTAKLTIELGIHSTSALIRCAPENGFSRVKRVP
jgi:hypothetical protein